MSAFVRQIAGPAVTLLFSACCCLIGEVACADSSSPDVVRRYEFGSIGVSLRYGYDVLDAALERSVVRYGSYRVELVTSRVVDVSVPENLKQTQGYNERSILPGAACEFSSIVRPAA